MKIMSQMLISQIRETKNRISKICSKNGTPKIALRVNNQIRNPEEEERRGTQTSTSVN